MKNLIAIGLAGALATASVGATTSSAQASTSGVVTGVVIGLGIAAFLHHYHPFGTTAYAYYPAYPADSHVAWCRAHYRSYSLATDTFIGNNGIAYKCVSPY